MDMNNVNIEEIVKQVLAGMAGTAPAASASAAPVAPAAAPAGAIPKTAHVAVLTEKEHFDIKEYPIPALGDDDILVKVEGCGVCGTDAHEFKRDPFNLIPVALGHEGTGEIVAMGKNVKTDTAGKPVKIGDKVVTCMIFKDDPEITMFDLNKKNVGGADVYGLLPDDDIHLNGWFSDYIFIRGGEFGSTFFNVSDLDLDSRILIEPCAVLVHAVERAKTTGILRFNSRVVVQGCGPIGLICIAVLRTMGIENICAVDGNQQRLDFAKRMGATMSVNFMHINANGDVEPCVFIHYSNCNIKDTSLLDALKSPIFQAYHDNQPFNENMLRPCPMLENPEILRKLVAETGAKSTDLQSPESAEHLCGKCDKYAACWKERADQLWDERQKEKAEKARC